MTQNNNNFDENLFLNEKFEWPEITNEMKLGVIRVWRL
jgi:hypothetical protein